MKAAEFNAAAQEHVFDDAWAAAELERVWKRTLRLLVKQIRNRFLAVGVLHASGELPGWKMPRRNDLHAAMDLQAAEAGVQKVRVRVAQRYVDGLGEALDVAFDNTNPLIKGVIAGQSGSLITHVTDAFIARAMGNLQDSYDKGLSIPNAARSMSKELNGLAAGRAAVISRTEIAGVANGATLAGAQLVGAGKNKVWIATADEHTRESHSAIDGESVPIDQPFSNGLEFPGDPNGEAEEVINCRCTIDFTDDSLAASGATIIRTQSSTGGATMRTPLAVAEPETEAPAAETAIAWSSVFAVEGVETSDGRKLAEGSTSWRDLPLTLMAQSVTDIGHDGAKVAGRIDTITRDGNQILATGVFSSDEYGAQIAQWVGDGTLRGISIDLAADEWEIEPYPEDEQDPADADLIDLFGPPGIMVVTAGTILGATITPFPAFAEASIMLASGAKTDDGKRRRVLRVNSAIVLADGPPAPGDPPAPAAPEGDAADGAAAIADLTDVASDYPGLDGQIVVTIGGEATTIPFPPAESAADGSPFEAAARALEHAGEALRKAFARSSS